MLIARVDGSVILFVYIHTYLAALTLALALDFVDLGLLACSLASVSIQSFDLSIAL